MAIRALCASSANVMQPTANAIEGACSPSPRGELGIAGRLLLIGFLGVFVTGSTGCTVTSGLSRALNSTKCIDDFMVGYRNRALAEKAWHQLKGRFPSDPHPREFKDGFISGYIDIASGGNGCSPSVAPSKYWGWRYQSGIGHQAINSWFHGFPIGVQAAEQDGVGNWQQISTNGLATSQVVSPVGEGDGSGATNPFEVNDEFVPAPEPIESYEGASGSGVLQEGSLSGPANSSPDRAAKLPPHVDQEAELELVMRPRHSLGGTDAATPSVGNRSEPPSYNSEPVVVDDVFGSASESNFSKTDSDELPFTFE